MKTFITILAIILATAYLPNNGYAQDRNETSEFYGLVSSKAIYSDQHNMDLPELTLLKFLPHRILIDGKKYRIIDSRLSNGTYHYECKRLGKRFEIIYNPGTSITLMNKKSDKQKKFVQLTQYSSTYNEETSPDDS